MNEASEKSYTLEGIKNLPKEFRRNLINGLSGFKSLCLAGTADASGHTNLSLISSVIHVGANPPYMGMLMRPHTVPRHTLENILDQKYFTLNHIREEFMEQAHQASAKYPREESEFDAVGLTPEYSQIHSAPYVLEAYVKIGLQLVETHTLQCNETILVVGEIIELILPSAAVGEDGFIDLEACGTITVAGLDAYYHAQAISRLPYARAKKKA